MNIADRQKEPPSILVVDDDRFMRFQLRLAMEQAEYQVTEAADGEEGLAVCIRENPDIVLLDAMMPVMDGFSCCKKIRSQFSDTPVLMITALEDRESVERAFEAGASDYITKPIHWAVLRLRVCRLLEAARSAQELQQQTDRAQKSEEQLRLALEAARMGTWDWDILNDRVTYSSTTAAHRGFSLDSTESTHRGFIATIHPEDRELAIRSIETAAKQQEVNCDVEFRVIWPADNSIHWVASKGQVYCDLTGHQPQIVRMTGIDMDITDRKLSEQKIGEQAALLDITTDAILVANLENQILFWNKGAERLYGWKIEEAIGKNVLDLLYKEHPPELPRSHSILHSSGSWHGELRQVAKCGKEIIVESRWTLVRDEQKQSLSILTVNTDITEKKQLETQFLRAQRMESIGTLASGIAHDLNNALAPILMSVQLLETKFQDDYSQRLLKILEGNTKRSADLVKQVLSFARGLQGDRTVLQVGHLISEIDKIVKQIFPKLIEIDTDVSTVNLWTVRGDATQLHQVLMNLCVNARDAMPKGGILSLSAENVFLDENYVRMNIDAKVGDYVVITVGDTGSGIAREILDRIFEPFFTTKEQGKGTGLGLSTAVGIIKGHGGFINVYSEVGGGTKFKVYLPAERGDETNLTKENTRKLPRGNGELIMVVDDEDSIREITKTSLENFNYKTIVAGDGVEAIALYVERKREISVVLVDMMMPLMDGPTTIRTLEKINPNIKIIAVSGLATDRQFAELNGTNVKTFLPKPYTSEELLKSLQSVIGR